VSGDIGLGLVNRCSPSSRSSCLTAFLLGSGHIWVERFLELRPPEEAARIRKALDHMARTVGGYVWRHPRPGHDRPHQRVHRAHDPRRPVRRARWRSSCSSPILIPLVGATLARSSSRSVLLFTDFTAHDHLGDLLDRLPSSSRTR